MLFVAFFCVSFSSAVLGGWQKFFRSLGTHLKTLQHLSLRVPESALQRREGVMTGLQETVTHLQQQALERGSRMQGTLQVDTSQETGSLVCWCDYVAIHRC